MYHFYDVVINDNTGVPLGGAIVRLYDGNGAIVALYADKDGTVPLEEVSRLPNAAVTDLSGNYDFYVADGTYAIHFFVGDALQKVLPNILMGFPDVAAKANATAVGVDGSADNLGAMATDLVNDYLTVKQALESAGDNLASSAPDKGAALIKFSIPSDDSIGITLYDWLRDQVILPRQFGVVGDGVTDDTLAATKFFNAIKAGKKGYIPSGCWMRITSQIILNLANLKHFYLEGAGAEVCGIRFSGTAAPFLRFNFANLYNAVHFRNLTLSIDTGSDASGCISLYGVGFGAPGNAAQSDFTDVVWRGWDGRVQDNYWGNCLYTELVSNVMIRGGGSWGPNDPNGKGDPFIFTGKASDANPYAVHFDFDTVYLTQFRRGITFGTYAQGLTLKAVNMNRGDYGVYIGAGQNANDIIWVGGGSQFNCNIASIGCFEDEATIAVSDTTFVIERANAVGIRTASRWGRFTGNHFQGIGSPSGAAGVHCIAGADNNIVTSNVFSYLPLGLLYDATSSANLQALNRFDNVATTHIDNGSGNAIGVVSI